MVHNIEQAPKFGGQIARAAGTSALVLSRDDKYVTIKMPSSEVRMLPKGNWCTVGRVGRPEHCLIKLGKAGKRRQLGFRPHVRGSAKTPATILMVVVRVGHQSVTNIRRLRMVNARWV